jgi:hypothetical protein
MCDVSRPSTTAVSGRSDNGSSLLAPREDRAASHGLPVVPVGVEFAAPAEAFEVACDDVFGDGEAVLVWRAGVQIQDCVAGNQETGSPIECDLDVAVGLKDLGVAAAEVGGEFFA